MMPKTGAIAFLVLFPVAMGTTGCGGGGGGGEPEPPPTPTNAKPTIQAIADQALTIGDTVAVTVAVNDADASDTHTLSATVSNEAAATVAVDGMELTITGADSGMATVTVTATDSSGRTNAASDPATFEVTVASESGWVRGLFEEASRFQHACAVPRTGVDPESAFADRQGTTRDENNWLRSWSDHSYLWYDEIVDTDPDCCDTPTYFELMKTMATTPSGAEKDRFHFSMDTEEWNALSQSGVSAGYGARFAVLAPRPPRDIRVAYTQPDSPATHPDVAFLRGTKILAIDGVDAIRGGSRAAVDVLNAGLFPSELGEDHEFTVQDPGSTTPRTVTLRSASITSDPVQHVRVIETDAGPVGYLLFLDHIATAEKRLVDSIAELADAEIEDLVLDIRYNGGGYTIIANQIAYMIAGASAAQGNVFSELRFNDKHTVFNPVTGEVLRPSLFRTTGVGLSVTQGEPLPTLDLERVFVLTGPGTCSASEAIINGLRGIDVEVILIGETTCGKPHGFYPEDNCGTTYFTVQFEIVNGTGFGDYAGGFTPDNAPSPDGVPVAGCAVGDDFDHAFGDTREARLNAALGYRRDTTCPEPPAAASNTVLATADSLEGGLLRSKMHGLTIPQDLVAPSG